jgi:glycosyltransferase involved in cell wall biosynthesis
MPSVRDCGGAVLLEAMAMGKPVIATAWGGALEYVDDSCGVLVRPDNRDALVEGFARAMVRLAASPDERAAMGRAGRRRIERHYDWEAKADRMLGIYQEVLEGSAPLQTSVTVA